MHLNPIKACTKALKSPRIPIKSLIDTLRERLVIVRLRRPRLQFALETTFCQWQLNFS